MTAYSLRLLLVSVLGMLALPALPALHDAQAVLAAEQTATADCPPSIKPRPHDQVWVISTRCLGCPAVDERAAPSLSVWLRDAEGAWQPSSAAKFLAAQSPERRVLFHMHGARTEHNEAVWRGYELYRRLTAVAAEDEPIDFVIWSWPTAPAGRPLRDLRAMAARSDVEAYYLAWLIARIDPATHVDLHGFSYGGRAATGAMHLLGGGSLLGRTMPSGGSPRTPINAALWTPALNNDWLLPGHVHGNAVDCLDRMLIIYNPCDRAMKHYHLVVCGRPDGLGYTGLCNPSQLGQAAARIEQWNGSGQLGGDHSFQHHMCSTPIMQKTQSLLFPAPIVSP